MKAILLVGGIGKRLDPYTTILPKPLLPLGEKPIIEHLILKLKKSGIKEIYLAVGYMANMFQSYFGDGSRFGVKIFYSRENKPLGTAGCIFNVLDKMSTDFFVINGDLLTNLNLTKMFDFHIKNEASATIGTHKRNIKIDFGVLKGDKNNHLVEFIEKPETSYLLSMGINLFNKKKMKKLGIKKNNYIDMPDLMIKLKEKKENVMLYKENCFWIDMGNKDDFLKANELYLKNRKKFI